METRSQTQPEQAIALLQTRRIMRLTGFTEQGISAAAIQRLEQKGLVRRLARGLYQLPGAALDPHHSLAEAAKRVPKGIVCLTSALAFHELTDAMPSRVWMAIGLKDWRPRVTEPPLQLVRFGPKVLSVGIETHEIEGATVPVYNPAKTIVDMFRYWHSAGTRHRQSPGLNLAIECLGQGGSQPKEIATRYGFAHKARISAVAYGARKSSNWGQ